MKQKLKPIIFLMFATLLFGCVPKPSESSSGPEQSISNPSVSEDSLSEVVPSSVPAEPSISEITSVDPSEPSSVPTPSTPSIEDPSSSEPSSNDPSSSEEAMIKAETPHLSVINEYVSNNKKVAEIAWLGENTVTAYEIMVNDKYEKTNKTTFIINYGQTITVRGLSRFGEEYHSDWSNPYTYFGNPVLEDEKYQVPQEGYAYVYFQNTTITPVQLIKGHSLIKPQAPTKEFYLFDNWYTDPHFSELFDFNLPIMASTTVYAKWVPSAVVDNVTFWIKANAKVIAPVQTPLQDEGSWSFIPLHSDDNWENPDIQVFKASVNVYGATSAAPAKLLVMDGMDDLEGRTYWKNESSNFEIYTDGYYDVSFSVQTHWKKDNGAYVNIFIERKGDNITFETPELLPNLQLLTPILNVDHFNKLVYFDPIPNATSYEYQINNGPLITTTQTELSIEEYEYVTVRAKSTDKSVIDSYWAKAVIVYKLDFALEPEPTEYVSVYFYGSDDLSILVLKGETLFVPADPVKDEYIFEGWFTTITFAEEFDFSTPITESIIIYGKLTYAHDLATKEYYEVVDSLGNIHAKFVINQTNYDFLEFKTTLEAPSANFTFFVQGRFNNSDEIKIYGSYYLAPKITTKLYFSPYFIWNVNTDDATHLYIPRVNIYFTQPKAWTQSKYYLYNSHLSSSNPNFSREPWPGSSMNYVRDNSYGEKIYTMSVNVGRYNTLIFNNGGAGTTNQTNNILLDGIVDSTQFYTTGATDSNGRLVTSSLIFK